MENRTKLRWIWRTVPPKVLGWNAGGDRKGHYEDFNENTQHAHSSFSLIMISFTSACFLSTLLLVTLELFLLYGVIRRPSWYVEPCFLCDCLFLFTPNHPPLQNYISFCFSFRWFLCFHLHLKTVSQCWSEEDLSHHQYTFLIMKNPRYNITSALSAL